MIFTLSPSIVLLGDYSNLRFNSTHSAYFFGLAMTAAKKCILSKWIAEDPPNHSHWVNELNYCMPLEKITYNVKGNPQRFLQKWQSWINFLETWFGESVQHHHFSFHFNFIFYFLILIFFFFFFLIITFILSILLFNFPLYRSSTHYAMSRVLLCKCRWGRLYENECVIISRTIHIFLTIHLVIHRCWSVSIWVIRTV